MLKFAECSIMKVFTSFSRFCIFCVSHPQTDISRPLFAAMDPTEHTRNAHEHYTTIIGFVAAYEAPPV